MNVVWRLRVTQRLEVLQFLAREHGRDAHELPNAIAEINRILQISPSDAGESRDGNERVLIVHPLSVFFEVFAEAQVVLIYSAVYYPRTRT